MTCKQVYDSNAQGKRIEELGQRLAYLFLVFEKYSVLVVIGYVKI